MRIAYFSPLNPQQSGISDYSESLLLVLSRYATVDIWVEGYIPSSVEITSRFTLIDYVRQPERLMELSDYDEVIYNLGNNPYYHSHIYDVFLQYGGTVILHEFVLYYLITGYYLNMKHSEELFLSELEYNDPQTGKEFGQRLLQGSVPPLQFKKPETWPLSNRVIHQAKAIIVHSEYLKSQVLSVNPKAKCYVINQIAPEPNYSSLTLDKLEHIRRKYKVASDQKVIASFGFIEPHKRIHQVIKALSELKSLDWKYILVGEGDYIRALVDKYGLQDRVYITGYTSGEEFNDLLIFADIIVNLRYPYMGETSASMIRAMKLGKATIVTDIGWFRELPDDTTIKVPIDEDVELNLLISTIERLLIDKAFRERLEGNAKAYGENNLAPVPIVRSLLHIINELNLDKLKQSLIYDLCDRMGLIMKDMQLGSMEQRYISGFSRNIYRLIEGWE